MGRIAATLRIARGKSAVGGCDPWETDILTLGPAMGRAIVCPTPLGPVVRLYFLPGIASTYGELTPLF